MSASMNWYALELDDPPARLPPLVDVGDRVLERGARDAERVRGDAGPRLVERREQDLQARRPGLPSRLARGTRQPCRKRAPPCRTRAAPSCLPRAPTVKPGVPFSSTSTEIALARVVDLAPLAEQQIAGRRCVAVGDEGLAAVDDDLVAVRREARRHAGGVGARARLGDGERGEAAIGDARQQPLLLLLAAEIDQRLHARGSWWRR